MKKSTQSTNGYWEDSRMVILTEKARNTLPTETNMWVTGSMTRWQVKAFSLGVMVIDTRDHS